MQSVIPGNVIMNMPCSDVLPTLIDIDIYVIGMPLMYFLCQNRNKVFSSFMGADRAEPEFIEPLSFILRHPLATCGKDDPFSVAALTQLSDKTWLLLANERQIHKRSLANLDSL